VRSHLRTLQQFTRRLRTERLNTSDSANLWVSYAPSTPLQLCQRDAAYGSARERCNRFLHRSVLFTIWRLPSILRTCGCLCWGDGGTQSSAPPRALQRRLSGLMLLVEPLPVAQFPTLTRMLRICRRRQQGVGGKRWRSLEHEYPAASISWSNLNAPSSGSSTGHGTSHNSIQVFDSSVESWLAIGGSQDNGIQVDQAATVPATH